MTPGSGPIRDSSQPTVRAPSRVERAMVFLAQGFGVGARLPAPGTWGSLLGLGLFTVLAWPGIFPLYVLGTFLSILISVPICSVAEGVLKRKDPGSVVLDELTAMPLVYLGWVTDTWLEVGSSSLEDLFVNSNAWLMVVTGFFVFRFFDILKPWPIRAVQSLPGGWGVVLDDVLAGFATAVVVSVLSRGL